jgi:hypothetical protein
VTTATTPFCVETLGMIQDSSHQETTFLHKDAEGLYSIEFPAGILAAVITHEKHDNEREDGFVYSKKGSRVVEHYRQRTIP